MIKRMIALLLALCLPLGLSGCSVMEAEPVKISWYMAGSDVELFNRLEGILAIEEATGVDVVFECPPEGSENAYKMMVASGKLPDVIMWTHSAATVRMFEEGTVIDLTELIAEHAPNLSKIYSERPELRREVETSDGRLYYFPSINPMQTVEEICRKSYQGFIIREDWLNKLGLDYPSTIDEWYEVLTAFKTRDPNGNGYQDEIPYDGQSLYCFAPAFGVLNTFCVKFDGTVAFGPMEAETSLIYPPYITMSVTDQAFCDSVMDEAATYIAEMELKFITGEESLDNFDLFVAQLEKMGVGRVLEIYRKAYEEHMN